MEKMGNFIQKHGQWRANLLKERKYFQKRWAPWNTTMTAANVFHIPDILTVSEPF